MKKNLIDLSSLCKMNKLLKNFLVSFEDSDQIRLMGAIQIFEICYELSWKMLQKFIRREGVEVNSPRETFRKAAQFGYIADPVVWFQFAEQRNLTVHSYQEEILNEIINFLKPFSHELDQLVKTLENKNSDE